MVEPKGGATETSIHYKQKTTSAYKTCSLKGSWGQEVSIPRLYVWPLLFLGAFALVCSWYLFSEILFLENTKHFFKPYIQHFQLLSSP